MRAQRFAFRNVVAADVFVRHVGEVSFQGSGVERREKAQATVDALYPEFQEMLRTFISGFLVFTVLYFGLVTQRYGIGARRMLAEALDA